MNFLAIPGFDAYEINREGMVRRRITVRGVRAGRTLIEHKPGIYTLMAPGGINKRCSMRRVDLIARTFGVSVREQHAQPDLPGEEWRPIPGLAERYEVSNRGRVRSTGHGRTSGRILRPTLNGRTGYYTLAIKDRGRSKLLTVHRAVASAFCGIPEPGQHANHIDGVKTNNRDDNLEWVTPLENLKHAYRTGLNKAAQGERGGASKVTEAQVLEIRAKRDAGARVADLAEEYGLKLSGAYSIVRRRTWQHLP